MSKVIYLKSLFKGVKPDEKLQVLIKDALFKANGLTEDAPKKSSPLDSRRFILKHTEEFLSYAVEYSMYDKFVDIVQE